MHEVIIFCNQNDQIAGALSKELLIRGHSVLMVTAEELAFAQWKHTIDSTGKCKTQIILPNGKLINSQKLKAAFNRIRFLSMFQFANEVDRNYAEMEIFAAFVSFLKGVNHLLINPLQTNHFIIEEENELLLKRRAVDAGIPVTDYHFSSSARWQSTQGLIAFAPQKNNSQAFYKKSPNLVWENKPVLFKEPFTRASRIIVVGDVIFGNEGNKFIAAIGKFAGYIGTPFFELQMVQTSNGYKLEEVNKFPVYGHPPVIEALAFLIEQKLRSFL